MTAGGLNSSLHQWDPVAPNFTMAAQVVMFVLIATVNVLTLVVMAATPRLQTIPNTYIAFLAVSDLVVSLNQLLAIPWTSPRFHGLFERSASLCLFFKCLLHVNELASLFIIVLIGLDRFVYIRHPFWYIRVVTKAKVKLAGLVAWVLSLVIAMPVRLTYSASRYPGCSAYAVLYDSPAVGYAYGVFYFVLCGTLFLSYGVVMRIAVRQAHAIRASQRLFLRRAPSTPSTTPSSSPSKTFHRLPSGGSNSSTQSGGGGGGAGGVDAGVSLKVVQKMAGVFLVLFVCWTPYAVIGLLGPLAVGQQVVLLSGFLAAFNSFANFGVYALADREFRTAITAFLCCRRDASRASLPSSLSDRHLGSVT